MDTDRPAVGDAVQGEDVQNDDVKARIQAWVSSASCWCDIDGGKAYCTPCEIMLDALDRIEYLELLVDKKVVIEESKV